MSAPAVIRPETTTVDAPRERPRTWWHIPTTLTVMGLIALVFFGLGGIDGAESTFRITRPGDSNLGGLVPESITVPSGATATAMAVVGLLAAAAMWFLSATKPKVPGLLKGLLIGLFSLTWIFAFMIWVVQFKTLDFTTLLQGTVALAVPLAFGALSGVLSERAGVVNIAIEGQLLFGAFGAALVGSMTGNPWIGVIAAPILALFMGALLALFAVGYHVQQIIVGVVLNMFAVGITSFMFGTLMRQNPGMFNSPLNLPSLPIPLLSKIPLFGPVFFNQNILVYLMYVIVAVLTVALFKTRWGLRVRSVGEHPKAADTVGINVARTRWSNVLLGSAVAGLGGATLTVGTGVAFAENMSAGKGYIALAAMILGRYHPVGALLAALGFAFVDSLQLRLGTLPVSEGVSIPGDVLLMLPYVVTLFAVAGFVGRVRVPAADGDPYIKQ